MFEVRVVPLHEMPSWYQAVVGLSILAGIALMVISFFVACRDSSTTDTDTEDRILSLGLALIVIPLVVMTIEGVVIPTISNL